MGLAERSNLQFGAFVQNYVENTTGNPNFTSPQPPLADVSAGLAAFNTKVNEVLALESQLRTSVAQRDSLRANLEVLMNASAAYVQQASNGNKAIIQSSGLGVRNPRTNVHVLGTPGNLRLTLTSNPGQPATVSVTVTGQTLHFHFGIPRGLTGEQGPPGEVTEQELADGLETRAFAIPSVGTLDQSAEPEYSPTQAQDIINTLNALITALKGS